MKYYERSIVFRAFYLSWSRLSFRGGGRGERMESRCGHPRHVEGPPSLRWIALRARVRSPTSPPTPPPPPPRAHHARRRRGSQTTRCQTAASPQRVHCSSSRRRRRRSHIYAPKSICAFNIADAISHCTPSPVRRLPPRRGIAVARWFSRLSRRSFTITIIFVAYDLSETPNQPWICRFSAACCRSTGRRAPDERARRPDNTPPRCPVST